MSEIGAGRAFLASGRGYCRGKFRLFFGWREEVSLVLRLARRSCACSSAGAEEVSLVLRLAPPSRILGRERFLMHPGLTAEAPTRPSSIMARYTSYPPTGPAEPHPARRCPQGRIGELDEGQALSQGWGGGIDAGARATAGGLWPGQGLRKCWANKGRRGGWIMTSKLVVRGSPPPCQGSCRIVGVGCGLRRRPSPSSCSLKPEPHPPRSTIRSPTAEARPQREISAIRPPPDRCSAGLSIPVGRPLCWPRSQKWPSFSYTLARKH